MKKQTTTIAVDYLQQLMTAAGVSLRKLAYASGVKPMAVSRLLRSGRDTQGILPALETTMNRIMQDRASSYVSLLAAEDLQTNSSRAEMFALSMNREIVSKVSQLRGTAEAK